MHPLIGFTLLTSTESSLNILFAGAPVLWTI